MQLIYLSPVPWLSFAQRPHKFVEWFHVRTGGRVLWIDPYPTRFPLLSDFRRIVAQQKLDKHQTPAWLKVIKPSALPIEPLPGSSVINGFMWANTFNEIVSFTGQKKTLLVIGKPSVLALSVLKKLKECRSVYDAMDDFPAFYAGISRFAMREREKQIVRCVDFVLASSTVLMNRWHKIRTEVTLVHNGLDTNILPSFHIRDTIKDNYIFGYVGTIASWFDWDLIIALAEARPKDVVRLIGPLYTLMPKVLPQNIETLPPCNHRAALLAMQDFDVGLIPFKKNELTASVDPIKYYEYRALGKPVISTDFGEMRLRETENGIFIIKSHQNINIAAEHAVLFQTDTDSIEQFRIQKSWSKRFDCANII